MKGFFIQNYHIYRTISLPDRRGGIAIAVRKGISQNHVDLPALVSVEATRVFIPIDNSEMLIATLYKSPGHAWIDADVIELLSFRHRSILVGDLNVKHPFFNNAISTLLGVKLLDLFDVNSFEISAPQCPTHYSPAGNGDILDSVTHQNIRVSSVIVSDILDSDHLPIIFHILDHAKTKNLSEPVKNFTDWERFQSLASDLILPRIEINSEEEADKAARDFTTSVASACMLSTSTVPFLDINNHDLPGLDLLLKHKH
jgi:hypothetical protein